MPIYVFRCEECGQVFEVFVFRSEEEEEIKCPNCGSENVVKELAPFGLAGGKSCGGMGFT
jgi:putative FmdB family regulatory protein